MIISLGLLIGIVGAFCIGSATALTPQGFWGASAGDELYYKVTSTNTGSEVITYAKVNVTNIEDSYLEVLEIKYYYNFIYAITYVYTGTAWVQSYPEVEWAGYNASFGIFGYYGGYQLSLGFPNPAPIPFSMLAINYSVFTNAFFSGWGFVYTTSIDGDTLTLENSTDSVAMTFNSTTGICTNNTHYKDGELYTQQLYLGETDPFYVPPQDKIPGFNPILIISMLGIAALVIGLKIKKKH
jgi:hypothetical protein